MSLPPSSPPAPDWPTLSPPEQTQQSAQCESPRTRAERELEESMRSSPPPELLEQATHNQDPPSQHDTPTDSRIFATPSPSPGHGTASLIAGYRNESVNARRLAAKLKVHPYQRDEAIELVGVKFCHITS
ncbi:hypothetical protein B0H34DRAFT_723535 [Crassisporium funariophilum]|nr:hypothetical protein B0H34DRAFT_723395 [Crassisporium funariophilum]KAF8153430.1 hypothetical protein B0H34DRAFT_723535 [Crassisporium funariophilum]